MSFNWCYFPLEQHGQAAGIQNPLPDFVTVGGNPWSAGNGWFNGNGLNTSLLTPWSADPALFAGVACPGDASYLIGFQLEVGAVSPDPQNRETILYCGYNSAGLFDGIRVGYRTNGVVRFTLQSRSLGYTDVVVETGDVSNSRRNIFCRIDHRPAGTGVNAAFTHTYRDGTDVQATSSIKTLSGIGDIAPQQITPATALSVGANQGNGQPVAGSYFLGKIRRLHLMRFGRLAYDEPGNLAELMGELSRAGMVPTPAIQQLMGFGAQAISRAFVQYS
ncbi:MAG: hypothetical protein R3F42_16290 [Pseudomonadota bacterium]